MDPALELAECACLEPDADDETLTARLRDRFPDDDLVAEALRISTEAHLPHRRDEGRPYIIHPLRVALTLARINEPATSVAAALCHDVLEDASPRFHHQVVALGPVVYDLVQTLTDDLEFDYLDRIAAAGPPAARIKLADRTDNVRFLHKAGHHKRGRYLRETRHEFPAIVTAAAAPDLAAAMWAIVEWQEHDLATTGRLA